MKETKFALTDIELPTEAVESIRQRAKLERRSITNEVAYELSIVLQDLGVDTIIDHRGPGRNNVKISYGYVPLNENVYEQVRESAKTNYRAVKRQAEAILIYYYDSYINNEPTVAAHNQ